MAVSAAHALDPHPPSRSACSWPERPSPRRPRRPTRALALKQRAEGDTPLIADTFELCDRIGGRITGTSGRGPGRARGAWRSSRRSASTRSHRELRRPLPLGARHGGGHRDRPRDLPAPGGGRAGDRRPPAGPSRPRWSTSARDWPPTGRRLGTATSGAIALVHTKEMKTFDDLFAEYMRAGPAAPRRRPGAGEGAPHPVDPAAGPPLPAPDGVRPGAGDGAGRARLPRAGRAAGLAGRPHARSASGWTW